MTLTDDRLAYIADNQYGTYGDLEVSMAAELLILRAALAKLAESSAQS